MSDQVLEGFYLSPRQRRLWPLQGAPALRARAVIAVEGPLDQDRLRAAVARVAGRHEILRSTFRILPGMALPLQVVGEEPVLAWEVAAEGPERHRLTLELPALCADAVSLDLLAGEIARAYLGIEEAAVEEPLPYSQFAAWQNQLAEGEEGERGAAFWRAEAVEPGLPLPFLAVPEEGYEPPFEAETLALAVDPEVAAGLRRLAAATGGSVARTVLAGWQALLWRLTRSAPSSGVTVGCVSDGRQYEELSGAVGLFTQCFPVRIEISGGTSFAEIAARAAHAWERGVEQAESFHLADGETFTALFEELPPRPAAWSADGVSFALRGRESCTEPFALRLACAAGLAPFDPLELELSHDPGRIDPVSAGRMAERLLTLLADAASRPEAPVGELEVLGPREREELLVTLNDTAVEPATDTFLGSFTAAAARSPQAPAVVIGERSHTYAELEAASAAVARHLRGLGGPERVIGLCAERSFELIAGLIGILKSGTAYLPLDPTFPDERLAYMVEDSGAAAVLAGPGQAGRFAGREVVSLAEALAGEGEGAAAVAEPESLAYLIYTSGSTGRPKGTMVTHGGLANYLSWARRAYGLDEGGEGSLFHTSIAFDLTVTAVLAPLAAGLPVRVVPESAGLEGLAVALRASEDLTLVKLSPAHLRLLARQIPIEEASGRARAFVLGGEALLLSDTGWWGEIAPDTRLLNEYGPTETVVGCTLYEVPPDLRGTGPVPIGRPIARTRVYLLDAAGRPVPAGTPGELHVAGAGVARGYRGRPDLTAERFLPDPFAAGPGERLYRTGDLARLRPDGELEFLGRIDGQVKIRGFRVELGEVEVVLAAHPGLAAAVVAARLDPRAEGTGERRLVAYVVPAPESEVGADELRQHCRRALPEFMVPAAFVVLPELPLTPHGKVDRAALPEPETGADLAGVRIAPRTQREEILAGIWCQVLRLPSAGIDDNFFTLGGDSIRSIEVVAQGRERGLAFSVDDLFRHPTVRALSREIEEREQAEQPALAPEASRPFGLLPEEDRAAVLDLAAETGDIEDAYPLTLLQAGMIFHAAFAPDSPIYHDITNIHFRAPIDPDVLRRALGELIERHPTLRTTFDLVRYSEPLQLVHRAGVVGLTVEDLRELTADEQAVAVTAWLEAEKGRGFDLERLPLVRFHLQLRSEDTFQLFVSFHHAILDGWSEATMLTELFHQYLALLRGEPARVEAPHTPFRDFLTLERRAVEEGRAFWEEKLAGSKPARLPRWAPPETGESRDVWVHQPDLPEEVSEGIKNLALAAAVPLKTVLLAAHFKVLSVLGGTDDVLTAMVASGRPETRDGERVLGLFINSMPLRLQLAGGTWMDLILATFEAEREAVRYRRYPWAELKRRWGAGAQETVFYFTHYHIYHSIQGLEGIELIEHSIYEQTSFTASINFYLDPFTERVRLTLKCDRNELSLEQVEDLGRTYVRALAAMADDPEARYEESTLLDEAARRQILVGWNDTRRDYPLDGCLHELFEAQADRTPQAAAVVFGEGERRESLTYRELEARASRLAAWLRRHGIGAESVVGVAMERSAELVVALMGILKAGGAYLPVDPDHPRERRDFVLRDAGVRVLLTQERLLADLGTEVPQVLALDATDLSGEAAERIPGAASPDHLAYVLYTSGSTGRPKGVTTAHRAIVNRLLWMQETYGLDGSDRVLQKTPFSFDVSVWEFFWPLATGAALVVARPGGHQEPAYLAEVIAAEGVTTAHFVPSMLRLFLEEPDLSACTPLRRVIASGEALPADLAARFFERLPGTGLHNLYGPTEAAVDVSFWACEPGSARPSVPIGKPIANVRLHVVDPGMRAVPVGVLGELLIGGIAPARGYLGRPALTAERFVPDPFADLAGEPGARVYRTGDLARYGADGALDFLGRIDHQVKIRGVRIELGEVEAALAAHPALAEVAVTAREDTPGQWRLVAYGVAREAGAEPSTPELRAFLKERLPEAMVPAVFLTLPALPLSPNGKVDRRALPAPGAERPELDRPYEPPRTDAERLLAELWQELLRLDRVGVHDNFFELGGDSILSTQLAAKAARRGLRITPRQVFEQPTVARLAAVAGTARRVAAEQGPVSGPVPLSPIQHWFFEADLLEPDHFNQALLLRARRPLAPAVLAGAVRRLLAHHDALRLRFVRDGQTWRQQGKAEAGAVPFTVVDLSAVPAGRRSAALGAAADDLQASLDLAHGPLLRAGWLDFGDAGDVGDAADSGRLLLAVHHLAIDGVSWRVLLEDLAACCHTADPRQAVLPPKTTSFKEWSERLAAHARSEPVRSELGFWLALDRGIRLPVDEPLGDNRVAAARTLTVSLGEDATRLLLEEVPEAYRARLDEVLLAALVRAFAPWTEGGALAVDLEGHGREELFDDVDLTRTVGWFTAVYPVALIDAGGAARTLAGVKERLRRIPGRGLGYGLLRYLGDAGPLLAAAPRPEVLFNYLGQLDAALQDTALFAVAEESPGEAQSPRQTRRYLFEVNARVQGGRLHVAWRYGSRLHRAASVERLAHGFLAALEELIAARHDPAAAGPTPADFARIDLTQDRLQKILDEVEL
jgi:amino acid adenylation domain-containing protein/non-ribosomal peptide synthase protein (TIGR01720 family)